MNTVFIVTLACVFAQSPHEYMKNNNFMGTNELLNFVLGRGWQHDNYSVVCEMLMTDVTVTIIS